MADHEHPNSGDIRRTGPRHLRPVGAGNPSDAEATPGGSARHRRRYRPRRNAAGPSSMQAAESAFRMLTTGPQPLGLDGRAVGRGLPRRLIPLDELRAILLHPSTGRRIRDAAWRLIIANARNDSASWVVGAAGMALPALRKIAADLADGYRGEVADLESAVLAGFVTALHRIDVDRPGVITRLRWAAYRAGITARYTREGIPAMPLPPLESQPPPSPWGHPDLILLDAVAKGVLSPLQAELIGRSRLEARTLKQAAAELDVGYEAACKARQRGEARLVAAMSSGQVEHRLSAPADESGLHQARATSARTELGGVRGRSTVSDGTSDVDGSAKDPDEEGAFCGPARRPSPPTGDRPSPRRRPGDRHRRSHHHGTGGSRS